MTRRSLLIRLEIVWWLITAVIAYVVLSPILARFAHYPFLWINIFYIAILVAYSRHIFMLKHTFLADASSRFKVGMIFLSIPLIAFNMQMLWEFQAYIDNGGHDTIFTHLKPTAPLDALGRQKLLDYIYTEMFFFGVGSIVVGLLLPLRMVLAIWRRKHRGTI